MNIISSKVLLGRSLCAAILSWFFSEPFYQVYRRHNQDFWDILSLKGISFPNFLFQTTTLLPKTRFCKEKELGDSTNSAIC